MRRRIGLIAAMLAVSVVGCSSGDAITIELALGASVSELIPFRASGVAVDEAAVCASGTMQQDRLESPEGIPVTLEEGAALYEAARANEGTMDVYSVEEFVCDDGSGTFTMKTHSHLDPAKSDSEQDTPTWEIDSGTGDYAGLSGSGDASLFFGASPEDAIYVYTGDVQSG